MKKRFLWFTTFWLSAIVIAIVERYVQDMMPFQAIDEWIISHPCIVLPLCALALLITIAWGIWGSDVFMPWKWSRYKVVEIHEVEVPKELEEKVFGKPQAKGKTLDIKNHVVQKKIKK